jgi:hypothetical protein
MKQKERTFLLATMIFLIPLMFGCLPVGTIKVDNLSPGEAKGYAIFHCEQRFFSANSPCFPCSIYDLGPEGSSKEVEVGDTGWVKGLPASPQREFKYSHKFQLALRPGQYYYRVKCYGWGV